MTATALATTRAAVSLAILLRDKETRRLLAREPVTDADLAEARCEAWRETHLRKGRFDVALEEAVLRQRPVFKQEGDSRCAGFVFQTPANGTPAAQCGFTIHALNHVATRASNRLVAAQTIQPGHACVYEIMVDDTTRPAVIDADPFSMKVSTPPLQVLGVPLAELIAASQAEGEGVNGIHPVFFTVEALAEAERISRRGEREQPPVETGGALVGMLLGCPATGEFGVVVTGIIEAVAAEQKLTSLLFTQESWSRILPIIRARRAAQPTLRLLGNAHGHNFLPNGGKVCERCATAAKCDLSGVFHSDDDRQWMQSCFPRQPWALSLIFGFTARGDRVRGLFGLHDGRWLERGFYVLPEFDPGRRAVRPDTGPSSGSTT